MADIATDLTGYRAQLTATHARLKAIYAGFDPARPEPLLPHEPEIVELINNAARLHDLIQRREQAEARRANVLAAWDVVRAHDGGAS